MAFAVNDKTYEKKMQISVSSLHKDSNDDNEVELERPCNESSSSIEIDVIIDSDTEDKKDSGICDQSTIESESILGLEQKIDRLSDLFLEQCRLLSTLKQEIRKSKSMMQKTELAHQNILADLLRNNITQSMDDEDDGSANCRAKMLLNAIENTRNTSIDSSIRGAVTNFLQSEELKQKMLNVTAESVKHAIDGCISQDISGLYLPILEHSRQNLAKHISRIVEESFIDLEKNSVALVEIVDRTSQNLRQALERHQNLLKAAEDPDKNMIKALQYYVEELLHNELKQWHHKVLDRISMAHEEHKSEGSCTVMANSPIASPALPAGPELSIVDQLMISAEITNQIYNGDVNGGFERALLASDLVLVVAACRAAEPSKVFNPCVLNQPVLLSLIQQLATDMLHDTQLKCRYLEEAIINLNTAHPDTRAHLPLVVGEVRKHLTKFLQAYPGHVAQRRIVLIIMAADNLLK